MDTMNSRSDFGLARMSGAYGLKYSDVARLSFVRRDAVKFDGLSVIVIVSRPAMIFFDSKTLRWVAKPSPPRNGSYDLYNGVGVKRRGRAPRPGTRSILCRRMAWPEIRSPLPRAPAPA